MSERYSPERQAEGAESHLDQLFSKVMGGEPDACAALEELSLIAIGGHERAGELVNQIDQAVEGGELTLPGILREQKAHSKLSDVLYILSHPPDALRAWRRQMTVALEAETPPHTSTFEEFPFLPLADAILAMREARTLLSEKGGVPKSAWSPADQRRLERGEKPKGYPEHPNV